MIGRTQRKWYIRMTVRTISDNVFVQQRVLLDNIITTYISIGYCSRDRKHLSYYKLIFASLVLILDLPANLTN